MSINSRGYQGEDDYQKIRAMLSDICRLADGTGSSPGDVTVGDLDWWRFADDDQNAITTAYLWLDDAGNVVAMVWAPDEHTEIVVHPGHPELKEIAIAWAEEQWAGALPEEGTENKLNIWAFDEDEFRTEILIRRGFQRQDTHLVYRRRNLDSDLPDAPLSDGYTFRDMTGDADIEQRVAVHRSAFHPSKMSAEKHRRVMSAPTYRPDLDTIAVAPDGTYAAYCIVWFDPDSQLGTFEPVGCHADHRQRGLASAVMVEAMRRARSLGARTVAVIANGGEPAANRLYESLGFQTIGEIHMWSKTFPAR
jgi:ribosomal protein S18 acetylase RimI-like enzyme